MRTLVVGDLHIGIKNNSLTWLESQLEFFDKQIFETIQNKEIKRVIFLGDIYDIRYSVNQQIGIELQKKVRQMLTQFPDVHFFMIAGNHDYYSPLEEFADLLNITANSLFYERTEGRHFFKSLYCSRTALDHRLNSLDCCLVFS